MLRRMGPGVVGAGVTQLNLAIDSVIASALPAGAVSFLYYADRVGSCRSASSAPRWARRCCRCCPASSGRASGCRRTAAMNRAIEFSLLLCLPAAMGQAAGALPIVETLFQRGAFGPAETAATAAALRPMRSACRPIVLVKVLAPGFFARGDTATPVQVGVGGGGAEPGAQPAADPLAVPRRRGAGDRAVRLVQRRAARACCWCGGGSWSRTAGCAGASPRLLAAPGVMGAGAGRGERVLFPVPGRCASRRWPRWWAAGRRSTSARRTSSGASTCGSCRAVLRRRRPPGAAPAAA